MKLKNNQTRKAIRLTLLSALCLSVFVMVSGLATAQTKSAKGINAGSSSIGAVVPEVANLESQVLETVTLMDDIEGCGAGNRFYDPDADVCRTTDPVDVEFTQSADETYVVIQNLNGIGESRHPLDGEDGTLTMVDPEEDPTPETPSYSSCSTPWGGTVNHGRTVTAYQASSVACGSACQSQTRRCNDGSLSGTYRYGRCDIGECATGEWVVISRRVDADVGCGEIALPDIDCYGMPNPSGSCNVGERTTVCRNLIGNFKCMQAVYECQ